MLDKIFPTLTEWVGHLRTYTRLARKHATPDDFIRGEVIDGIDRIADPLARSEEEYDTFLRAVYKMLGEELGIPEYCTIPEFFWYSGDDVPDRPLHEMEAEVGALCTLGGRSVRREVRPYPGRRS